MEGGMSLYDPSKPIRTTQGRVIMPGEELGKLEHMVRMLGFTPHTLRQQRLQKDYIQQLNTKTSAIQDYYYSQLAKVLARKRKLYKTGNKKEVERSNKILKRIWKDIHDINKKSFKAKRPDKRIHIDSHALARRVLVELYGQNDPRVLANTVKKNLLRMVNQKELRARGLK